MNTYISLLPIKQSPQRPTGRLINLQS